MTRGQTTKSFFTLIEYEQWKETHNDGKGWKIKYYKGLGTSTSAEAKEYFSDLNQHQLDFYYSGHNQKWIVQGSINTLRCQARRMSRISRWLLAKRKQMPEKIG